MADKKGRFRKGGQVNHHFLFIEVPSEFVVPEVMKWGEATWWPKSCDMRFIRTTPPGEVTVGTRYRQKIAKPLAPRWDVEVTRIVPNKLIERTFLNGLFKGHETVTIEWRYNGTRVDYDLKYEIRGLLNKLLWPLVYKKLHDQNIELILESLKNYVKKMVDDQRDQKLEGES